MAAEAKKEEGLCWRPQKSTQLTLAPAKVSTGFQNKAKFSLKKVVKNKPNLKYFLIQDELWRLPSFERY